ncbi:COX15/CtaA family protein [Mangrovivirga sp. M17]|uniref:COX15/CtaA family protein n=1 Tax=Mangrovivirga halotolerans TaxID=2993936 RepID=A0ABT3RLI0_9BACT|nr:COX15/CtaA family protein [Mangrovivirga halotolerans]
MLTVFSVYILILVGGIVRSTGAGMGCPDWPKCFGQWVPPTSEEQLPEGYENYYTQKRVEKNEKLAGYLNALGFSSLAYEISNDPMVMEEQPFNPTKTWIEYVNRIVGVIIGLFIFATLVFSVPFAFSNKKAYFWLAFLAFILVGIEGWIGSVVVSTNLMPWMITVHMILALFIVLILERLIFKVMEYDVVTLPSRFKAILWIGLILSFVQIILGTQVRESIDEIALAFGNEQRELWIGELGLGFYIHRSFSLVIFAVHCYVAWVCYKLGRTSGKFWKWLMIVLVIIGVEIISGVIMAYFAIPAVLQPVHLLCAALMIGIQYWIIQIVSKKKEEVITVHE